MLSEFPIPCKQIWESDNDVTLGDIWDQILQSVQLVSLSLTHRVTQLFILNKACCNPELLHRVGRRENSECVRCAQSPGSVMHLFWRCSRLNRHWQEVLDMLNHVYDIELPPDPVLCLLGYVNITT